MNAKEFIEFSDRMFAFKAVMQGELKKEVQEASKALQDLNLGKDLCIVRNRLRDEQKEFEEYKKEAKDDLEQERGDIFKRNQDLTVREATLQEQLKGLQQGNQALLNARGDFENQKELFNRCMQEAEAGLLKRKQDHELAVREHNTLSEDLIQREDELQKRLDVLKNI